MALAQLSSRFVPAGGALRAAAVGLALSALSGCNLVPFGLGGGEAPPPAPAGQLAAPAANGPTVGQTFGTGAVRVGLVLPLTQNGQPFAVGTSLSNAAQLAIQEAGGTDVTMMLLDDHGTASGAAQAAASEFAAGAQIVFGPLFADSARQASAAAQAEGRPMVAFSTDISVARPGVYLLSFLNENYVNRIMEFAADAFNAAAARLGIEVVTVQRYAPGQAAAAVQQIAASADRMDALFAPEQADAMGAVADALAAAGVHKQLLGTGVWNDPRLLASPNMRGAWFAAPENAGFSAFAKRYQAQFHSSPARLATLAYDAMSLATGMARKYGANPF